MLRRVQMPHDHRIVPRVERALDRGRERVSEMKVLLVRVLAASTRDPSPERDSQIRMKQPEHPLRDGIADEPLQEPVSRISRGHHVVAMRGKDSAPAGR